MEKQDGVRIFKDAIAIVTGGASGIGRALTLELISRGAIVVVADLQIELVTELVADICSSGGQALAKKLDVKGVEHLDKLDEENDNDSNNER